MRFTKALTIAAMLAAAFAPAAMASAAPPCKRNNTCETTPPPCPSGAGLGGHEAEGFCSNSYC